MRYAHWAQLPRHKVFKAHTTASSGISVFNSKEILDLVRMVSKAMADSTLRRNMNDSAAVSWFFARSIRAVSIFLSSVSRVCLSIRLMFSKTLPKSLNGHVYMALNSSTVVPQSMWFDNCSRQHVITFSIFMS